MNSCQEVVFAVVQHRIAHCYARRNQFGDAPLDEFLRQLGIFQLVADGHSAPGPHQLGQIGVEGMIGESCHGNRLIGFAAIIALGEGDT